MVAKVSTVAEPVDSVSHQIKANCTKWLPSSEKAWPVQMMKNGTMDCACARLATLSVLLTLTFQLFAHEFLSKVDECSANQQCGLNPQSK
jgi:hypothetical protein